MKIAPAYDGAVVHVADASRVVDVVAQLLNPAQRPGFAAATKADQAVVREKYAARQDRPTLPYARALANRLRLDLSAPPPVPSFLGARARRGAARPSWCRTSTGRSSSPPGS